MRLGTSSFLLALGAILAFAVHVDVSGLDLTVVGWILMAVGALGLVLEFALFQPRRRASTTVTTTDPAHTVQQRTTREY
ncbi:DUF6458 family protein [Kineococcus sp. SYSU DK005]|uniref:DUF6458 family protein n=1 Tax=Kineococcus sp. SYSU DK005 TaxID=3383126 RepID=UPI003D7E3DC6